MITQEDFANWLFSVVAACLRSIQITHNLVHIAVNMENVGRHAPAAKIRHCFLPVLVGDSDSLA